MKSGILSKPSEVSSALDELELGGAEDTIASVVSGEGMRDSCTANDPLAAPGILAWSFATRRFRELHILKGWTVVNKDGLALTVSPSGKHAIAVSTGDEGTGIEKLNCRSKYPKGPAVREAIKENRRQGEFWPDRFKREEPSSYQTWFLLRRRDEKKDLVYCELSLPSQIDNEGYVVSWRTRIIIGPISLHPQVRQEDTSPEPEKSIEIEIKRRT